MAFVHTSAPAAPSVTSYSRGLAALDRGDFDSAIVDFTAAMGDDPKDTFAYLKRATAYEKKGDSASAISDYRNEACRPRDP
jgi:Tfp pilus assembly protein PilF